MTKSARPLNTDTKFATDCVKHIFGEADWNLDFDPVTSRRACEILLKDSVRSEPFVDEINAFIVGRDELVNFVLSQMLAVTIMVRVALETSGQLVEYEVGLLT